MASRIARSLAGPLAAITAGWQENENDPLPRGLNGKSKNLGVYRRAERVFDEDRELFQAHRERQVRLKQLQRLYRVRLDHSVAAFRDLFGLARRERDLVSEANGAVDPSHWEPVQAEVDAALEAIRSLDQHHLDSVSALHQAFEAQWQPNSRPAVARQREELAEELAGVQTVVVAGGHVAVLLNRMRLFDLAPLLAGKTLIAWSAGAMVASRRIVLFHDSPPWGAGNSEVLDYGLGLFDDVLPLPDPGRRLRVGDPRRVTLLARRFAPLTCVGLDEATVVSRDAEGWHARSAPLLGADGATRRIGRSEREGFTP